MLKGLGRGARLLAFTIADGAVTLPILRWTWRGLADDDYAGELPEFRPSDPEAVRDMMAGRYLLSSRLVETGGVSPFAVDVDNPEWWANLHGFGWLRHFRDIRDNGQRTFARTLVLDWIGREGAFNHRTWTPVLTAQRVLNWLRHLPLLLDGATPEQSRTIRRVLGTQIQSLKLRGKLAVDPVDRLFAAIALLGAEYCDQDDKRDPARRLDRLNALLDRQIDEAGLHRSRNPKLQLHLLGDLLSVRRVTNAIKSEAANELGAQIDRMHEALDALTLSSGEPVYFNGCGQLPHDVLVAIQSQGPDRRRRSMILGGYGILRDGEAVVIADSGLRPPKGFDEDHYQSALAVEFSHGSELILGSCGPAPANMPQAHDLFRQGVAHSAPTIDGEDAQGGQPPGLRLEADNHLLSITTDAYAKRFGIRLERRLTLLSGGTTLVGQDIMSAAGGKVGGTLSIRFHLAPGVMVRRVRDESIVRLVLPNGTVWSFLWEGARFDEQDSVRQSAYLGFDRTRQLVLEAPVSLGSEVAWILTREQ